MTTIYVLGHQELLKLFTKFQLSELSQKLPEGGESFTPPHRNRVTTNRVKSGHVVIEMLFEKDYKLTIKRLPYFCDYLR